MTNTVLINEDLETVWDAITDEKKLSEWYVPGSFWVIPKLSVGEIVIFTLMPSVHNKLTEKLPMTLTIKKLHPFKEFTLYLDSQQMLLSFFLEKESTGIRVSMNLDGFDQTLANLKAFVEGYELPYL